jgi:hypothetical protein
VSARLKVPAKAVLSPLDRQWAAVALTWIEVVKLLAADGYSEQDILNLLADWSRGGDHSVCLRNGAKVQPGGWIGQKPPTKARTYRLSGYHYAGTDVAELVEVSA